MCPAVQRVGMCPAVHSVVERIRQDIDSLVNNSVLSTLGTQDPITGPGYGACGCGGFGWRRAAYLNMSDPTQTCPPAWELITTPRRSCGRPSNASSIDHVFQLCSLLKVFNTLRSVEETRLELHKHFAM